MKPMRLLAGWLCIAIGFALVVLLALGVLDPVGASAARATSLTPVLVALLPSVSVGIAIFAVGVWLISTGRKSK
ncbi:hypothetical protein ACFQZQ_05890 [Lysobacter koreensis]|uniref:Uncharacterized protein n=1 Tax=Lysobacter koreensis TaxID=266122 RepID=A0ABW2YK48_9GAMM